MPSRKDRFGHLGGHSADARGSGQTADLFEHYGIPLQSPDRSDPPSTPDTVIAARPCRRCEWFVALGDAGPCRLCGEATPLAQPPTPGSR
ncbi:MAG: hypothetical protein ACE37F_18505 [Nannocystaceae bacterium]|nr:hypothetical protein [bacterium]